MLAEAAVAVFPSYAETFAMAPLEAMACGCPTIYSRIGSGPELMEDARHGLLVEPKRPKEIAAAIVRLLKDRAFARGLGEAGQQRASSLFSMENLLPENVAFYRTCVKEFQAGAGSDPWSRTSLRFQNDSSSPRYLASRRALRGGTEIISGQSAANSSPKQS